MKGIVRYWGADIRKIRENLTSVRLHLRVNKQLIGPALYEHLDTSLAKMFTLINKGKTNDGNNS